MIRKCRDSDFAEICRIINDGAQAYRGVIPADRWREPYMGKHELASDIADGVVFWGAGQNGHLNGVMGIQDKGAVTLIRHAYVLSGLQNRGIGTRLLRHCEELTDKPILIGTWAAAAWAIAFYQKNGFRLVTPQEKNRLLKKYWAIPERQVETSVVLQKARAGGV